MRLVRPLALAAALAALAADPARAAPPERFVAPDASMAVIVPSLEVLARQGSDLLATAATFPDGEKLLDGRAVLARRVGFDLLDPAALRAAGLDPKGGAAVVLQASSPDDEVDVAFSLPLASAARFEASLRRVAGEKLKLVPDTKPGKPAVTAWRDAKTGHAILVSTVVEGTAIVGLGDSIATVRAAVAVRKDRHLGTAADYRSALRSLGGGLAAIAFLPAGSSIARRIPGLDKGFALGLAGGRDRLRVVATADLGEGAALVRAPRVDAGPLVAKLDPASVLVLRNASDLRAFVPPEELIATLEKEDAPADVRDFLTQATASLGSGMAVGLSVVPMAPELNVPSLKKAPMGLFRAEAVLGVVDAARMKRAIRRLILASARAKAKAEVPVDGPWVTSIPGGEVGLAVDQGHVYAAAGPTGSLEELLRRTGSTFHPPTPTAARAFAAPLAGLFVDVPAFAAELAAIPEDAYRDYAGGGAKDRRENLELARVLKRIKAVSLASDLVGHAQRTELVVEVAPAAADDE